MGFGFEQAGFDVLAAVDLDPVHLAAHERNFPMSESICGDISELSAAEVAAAARIGWRNRGSVADFAGPVDCVFGGPSCQGFSVMGRQDPRDPRNALVAEFARMVVEIRPRWFVLENVPGLVSANYREILSNFYRILNDAGYKVAEPWLLNARDFQVPQERRRVFIVGARADDLVPTKPEIGQVRVTVGEALGDLYGLSRFRTLYERDHLDLTGAQLESILESQSVYVRTLNGTETSGDDYSDPRSSNPLRLLSVGLTRHSDAVKARLRLLRTGERDEVGRLPRLDPSSQSPTLRAGTGRDHGSFTSARPIHPTVPRVITVREAARLHGFPDWFGFHATKWHGFRQVGNAVPPPLARAVAGQIVAAAGVRPGRRTDSISPGSDSLLEMSMGKAARYFDLEASHLPVDVRRAEFAATKEAA